MNITSIVARRMGQNHGSHSAEDSEETQIIFINHWVQSRSEIHAHTVVSLPGTDLTHQNEGGNYFDRP